MLLLLARGLLDRSDDSRMRAAAADIPLQRLNDLFLAGVWIGLQQGYAAHDHSRTAVRTLKSPGIKESLLNRMQGPVFFKTFNRGNWTGGGRTHRNLARSPRCSSDQNRARATRPFPAAVLRAGQAEFIAQDIQQRGVRRVVDRIACPVDFECNAGCHTIPFEKAIRLNQCL